MSKFAIEKELVKVFPIQCILDFWVILCCAKSKTLGMIKSKGKYQSI
jgi:hypothetical protein